MTFVPVRGKRAWEEGVGSPELTALVVTEMGRKRNTELRRKGETSTEIYGVQVTM